MEEIKNAGEILINLIRGMSYKEQCETLYLIQGARIGEMIGTINAEKHYNIPITSNKTT